MKLKLFIVIFISFVLTGCVVKVDNNYDENAKYSIDNDLTSDSLSDVNEKVFMQDIDRCQVNDLNLIKNYIIKSILKKYNPLAECLINSDVSIINEKIGQYTPLSAATTVNNQEIMKFILKQKTLDFKVIDYSYIFLKHGYVNLAYNAFKKTYINKYNDDYAIGLERFISKYPLININMCNNKPIKNKVLNVFFSDIKKEKPLDIEHYCVKNDYFKLKSFHYENINYRSNLVKKELYNLLNKLALKDYFIAIEYLKKYPKTSLSVKVRNKLPYLMYVKINKTNSISLMYQFLKKYPYNKYSKNVQKKLEKTEYQIAMKNNSIYTLEKFKKKFPHSKYLVKIEKKILSLKHENVIKMLFANSKGYSIDWNGKIDNEGWPVGKGYFHITKALQRNKGLLWSSISLMSTTNVYVKFKNHRIKGEGKTISYIEHIIILFGVDKTTSHYKRIFNNMKDMYASITSTINQAIEEWNNRVRGSEQKNTSTTHNCQAIYKTCMSYCDKKSTKEFFDDKSSCQNSCITGKNSCEEGNFYVGKIISCKGICKGVNSSNGSFFGWGASSFDKCVDNCTDEIGK